MQLPWVIYPLPCSVLHQQNRCFLVLQGGIFLLLPILNWNSTTSLGNRKSSPSRLVSKFGGTRSEVSSILCFLPPQGLNIGRLLCLLSFFFLFSYLTNPLEFSKNTMSFLINLPILILLSLCKFLSFLCYFSCACFVFYIHKMINFGLLTETQFFNPFLCCSINTPKDLETSSTYYTILFT